MNRWSLVTMLGLSACGDPPAAQQTTGSASGAAAPPGSGSPTASAAATAAAFDTTAFCERLCKRSTSCGIEAVEALAKSGDEVDKKALEKAKTDAPTIEKTCVAKCTKSPPAGDQIEQAKKADACVAAADCAGFESCRAALTK
jgi:hypothetical protein